MIKIEHLRIIYANSGLEVLSDVNAEIRDGEVISIIGPSGTGKSTLLRCINRLERPTSGKIIINGVDVLDSRTNLALVRRKVGMVFQSFNLFDHLSVLDNVMIGPIKLLGMSREDAAKQARELLFQVGMLAKAEAFPSELSGGQKQRVAIARCLSMKPEVILFDEPTSALDPTMVSEVLSVIRDISKQGITMLIVTHEMKFARNVSTRVFYMDRGVIYEEGTPGQIFENPQKPLTKVFINRIRSITAKAEDECFDVYSFFSKISKFCMHYGLSELFADRIKHLIEEAAQMCLQGGKPRWDLIKANGGLEIKVKYSEKLEKAEVNFFASDKIGTILNREADQDGLALALINAYCSELAETVTEDGRLRLKMQVK